MMELLQFDKLKNAAVLRVENFLLIKLPHISGKRAQQHGMGCKAQSTAIPVDMASICNAADRPSSQMHAVRRFVKSIP
jgi:hypothetical protein